MIFALVAGLVLVATLYLVALRNQRKLEQLRNTGMLPPAGRETESDVDRLIQLGQKIEAIKVYRGLHRVGLKEAKEAVEKRQSELGR